MHNHGALGVTTYFFAAIPKHSNPMQIEKILGLTCFHLGLFSENQTEFVNTVPTCHFSGLRSHKKEPWKTAIKLFLRSQNVNRNVQLKNTQRTDK